MFPNDVDPLGFKDAESVRHKKKIRRVTNHLNCLLEEGKITLALADQILCRHLTGEIKFAYTVT